MCSSIVLNTFKLFCYQSPESYMGLNPEECESLFVSMLLPQEFSNILVF